MPGVWTAGSAGGGGGGVASNSWSPADALLHCKSVAAEPSYLNQ